ncbi:DEAD/DEAH box helicase [Phytoactinopolyspora limicola]|uniref:DEAD/DEAH box helicase n=1 Tax=Phytoactinopolyspora limicola TaxID=2715536 RepID=UPI0014090F20|nr:DEAD/DEAH box helicase [Phytoactinopolyspora limicola]
MLVIHSFWAPTLGVCGWAEDGAAPVSATTKTTGRVRPHPFAATTNQLAQLTSGAQANPGLSATATVLLPSTGSAPLDSPELVRQTPRRKPSRPPRLTAWTVPAVRLTPSAVPSLLDQPSSDARPGASLHYLADVVAFTDDLVERGRFLPTLHADSTGYTARWRPVLQGPDAVAAQDLTAAMPPICRAGTDDPANRRGEDPSSIMAELLATLVDGAVRKRLTTEESSPLLAALPRRRGRTPRQDVPVEAWLTALTTPDGRFDADDIAPIRSVLADWDDVGTGPTGPARATFRLTEADSDTPGDTWRVEFLLQSVQDPSLLVPADQVWTGDNGLHRWLARPDELLLAELGRASTLDADLAQALRQARPEQLDLDADGAYRFLSTTAPKLDQAGFGVLLPSWWRMRRTLGLTASATTPRDADVAGGRLGQEQLMRFDWQLAVDGEPLTQAELDALVAAKAPLVRLRGEWVAVDPDQLRRGLEFLRDQAAEPAQKTATEILALAAAGARDLATPLPVTAVTADGWLGDLLAGSVEQTLQPIEPPDNFRATLRPYQERGLSWLSFLTDVGLGGCLADDMGLGKTVQLLALEAHDRATRPGVGPTLLICPTSLVGNWQREAARFAPALTVHAHHGPGRLRGDALADRLDHTDLLITTYQTAVRDTDDLTARPWHRLVLDEAQAIKNRHAQASTAVRGLTAGHRVALTGTPVENRLTELWSIMDFLNPGVLGSPERFRSRYAVPIERHGSAETAERLRTVTRPYVLRRLKTDREIIDDLPDKLEIKQYYQLTTEQATLYQSVVDDMMGRIENSDGIERRGHVLATMAKLKQVCNHPAQLLQDGSEMGRRSGKVIRLDEVMEEILAEGDRVLCFTQYTQFAQLLLPHLAARFQQDVLYLHGGTPKKRRDEMVERFQSGDGPPIFLLSLKAGGTGLNLTAANHVLHLDRWWNPAVEDQATDRAFRIGQKRNVQVRKFVCIGTLEERIDDLIEEKKALAGMVVGDGERWLTELSTSALREIFTLSEGAVGE